MTVLGTGVDGAVRRLALSYDVRGQVFQSTSYDHAAIGSGSILNQVQKSYNDFEQLVTEYHSHGGSVNTMATPKVQYGFADGSDNTVRPIGMVYPNGRELTFEYGTANGIDDSSSRIAAIIDDDTTHLVEYEYLGQNSFVIANNPQPDLEWTLASLTGTNDPDTGDIYAGLDRFGRIKDCRWRNTSEDTDIVRLEYGYDRDSNRLWRQDDIARSLSKNFDELYTYDGLQRLKTMQRGLLDSGHTSISNQTYGQCWNLDATENWTGMKQAEGGTDWTLEQSRTANMVNEITDIINAVGPIWAVPAYDLAGNMTTIPHSDDPSESLTATWDAWNRLVKLVDTSTSNTIAEYQYDASNRRILKKLYTSGTLTQTRHIYVSNSNQVLEERLNTSASAATQNIWGLQYIDGLILRDRDTTGSGTLDERRYCLQDANWNTVALADESGTIIQRFAYQPFGTVQFLTANYATNTNTSAWTTLFTGRELDPESGLYYFRARYWHSILGVFIGRDPLKYVNGGSLYAGQFVPTAMDPHGTDVYLITNENAVVGNGHSAIIVGNPETGYSIYSYGSGNSSGSGSSSSPSSSAGTTSEFKTYPDAESALTEAGSQGYTSYLQFKTTPEQDQKAVNKAEEWNDTTYNLFWNNCGDMAVGAANAAGCNLKNKWRPNSILKANKSKADSSGPCPTPK